ncbi:MAG: MBL fold metallo-hydrolase [Caldilineaceae bacterium]|nr:MBL fold metallo-hydrolase [Caldilineaceae bacterium]
MKLTFYGAAREVTGSMHMLEVNDQRILLDCGFYQGRRDETYARNLNFAFDPQSVDAVVLSHAHIDHSGNLPNLVKQGFGGAIWCTAATRNLCAYMLMDSGHILEKDVEYLNRKRRKAGEPLLEPIYTQDDAQRALESMMSVGLHRSFPVADGVTCTFFEAGHILGAAVVQLDIKEHSTGKAWRLVFSGDLGRSGSPILHNPERIPAADIVIMESTYGDKLHGDYASAGKRLRQVINETARRRGKVIIPAFAVGRTQELVYAMNQLDAAGDIPPHLPLFVDSPLAVNATDIFRMHPEEWNAEVKEFVEEGGRRSPFDYEYVEYVRSVRRSKQLNTLTESAIIISASGMAENGRILHHLKNNIESPANTVLLVSFMAEHTLGRKIKDGVSPVRIFGEMYDVRAEVDSIDGYSAHGDQAELMAWAGAFDPERLEKVFLVHGEPEPMDVLAAKLRSELGLNVATPSRTNSFTF